MAWALTLALIFVFSALIGVWAAYDRRVAGGRCALIVAGLAAAAAIAWAGRRWGDRALGPIGVGCAVLAAAIGAFFLQCNDWSAAGAGKFAVLQQVGLWIQAHRPAIALPEDINGNVAGNALALLIPLGVGGTVWAWRTVALSAGQAPGIASGLRPLAMTPQDYFRVLTTALTLALISTVALALSLAALVLTASRGAWAGLAAGGAVTLAAAGSYRRRTPANPGRFPRIPLPAALILALTLASAVVFWAAVALPGFDRLLGSIGSSALSRAALWRDGLALAGDTPFTGAGLGSTMMVYSTYAMLLHVGFITHSHNLFLQIVLEQGLPGLAAFVGLLLAAGAGIRDQRLRAEGWGSGKIWRAAALASLAALIVHGTVDTGVYASKLLPVMFVPFGFAFGAVEAETKVEASVEGGERGMPRAGALTLTLILVLILASSLASPVRAAFQANLGAVAQGRAELAVYDWPAWPIQDALRRSPQVHLAPAIARYRAALALDARNVAANRRLGQIELSRGEYEAARTHLADAYAVAPEQRATRQLLGELYAVAGETQQADALWRTLDLSEGQLALRQWWYAHAGEPAAASNFERAVAALR